MANIIGKRIPRIDGPQKATGEAKYTTDIFLPDMLCAKILRSPIAHAKILKYIQNIVVVGSVGMW